MSTRVKAILLTFTVAIPAFLLIGVLFPPPPGPGPSSGQVPYFVALSALDSVLLGAGIAFIVFGWSAVRRLAPESRARAIAMFVALAWLMVSWYPHIGLHTSAFGSDFTGILVIDYLFHVPLIISTLVLVWGFAGLLRNPAINVRAMIPHSDLANR